MQSYEDKSNKNYEKSEKIIEKIYREKVHLACAPLYYKKTLLKFDRRLLKEALEYATISEKLFN